MRRIKQGAPRGHDGNGSGNRLLRLLTLRSLLRGTYNDLPEPFGTDLRGLGPIHVCPCGSQVFNVMCSFEDHELVWYFLDGTCVNCGNIVTVPCPVDKDETQTL